MVGKPEGERQFWKSRRKAEENIKVDLKEILGKEWTGFIWLATSNTDRLLSIYGFCKNILSGFTWCTMFIE
jgi:hypothetical protein